MEKSRLRELLPKVSKQELEFKLSSNSLACTKEIRLNNISNLN